MKMPRKRDPGDYLVRFGEYGGRTIKEISSTTPGLIYLDFLPGYLREKGKGDTALYKNVVSFLGRKEVKEELERVYRRVNQLMGNTQGKEEIEEVECWRLR